MLTGDLERMCIVRSGPSHGAAPIPEEGNWVRAKEISDISGFAHGCGTCAPQMGASKLTLNVKAGIIQEALIENIGCSGMTQSAAMAAEILPGKTILEALNTDLVCDAINSAMKQLFLQIAYGRTQSSFSDGGLPIGGAWEDLGAELCSQTGTSYGTVARGPRYLNVTGGYVTRMGLDENNEVIGYELVQIGKMMGSIAKGMKADDALREAREAFGRFDEAVKYIDPRRE
jgi:NifU-like protein involved in Fe-S cluster formation